MSELHPVGVSAASKKLIEAVSPDFIKSGLLDAREKSWMVFEELRNQLKIGMTEAEGQKLAFSTFEEFGVTKHWHKPYIRFGPGTALTFHDNLQAHYQLQQNDPIYLDLGPVWTDEKSGLEYEGDVGDSFIFGSNPEAQKCIDAVHSLFKEAFTKWKDHQASGEELYSFFKTRTLELDYVLIEKVNGHRLSDYPHVKYSKERLSKVHFVPADSLWILELQIKHPTLPIGAFYEDLLYENCILF